MEECGCSRAGQRRFKILLVVGDVWVILYFCVFGGDTVTSRKKGDDDSSSFSFLCVCCEEKSSSSSPISFSIGVLEELRFFEVHV